MMRTFRISSLSPIQVYCPAVFTIDSCCTLHPPNLIILHSGKLVPFNCLHYFTLPLNPLPLAATNLIFFAIGLFFLVGDPHVSDHTLCVFV